MIAFEVLFPDVASRELRSARLTREAEPGEPGVGLPPGSYAFTEFYCVDPGCDCRRVILNVLSMETGELLAVISYGFDPRDNDRGPFLDPINPQSECAPALLELARDVVLQDADYVARLEAHYQLVKEALVDLEHPIHQRLPSGSRPEEEAAEAVETFVRAATKIGRNDPCYCDSGKKFKRCCLLVPARSWQA